MKERGERQGPPHDESIMDPEKARFMAKTQKKSRDGAAYYRKNDVEQIADQKADKENDQADEAWELAKDHTLKELQKIMADNERKWDQSNMQEDFDRYKMAELAVTLKRKQIEEGEGNQES